MAIMLMSQKKITLKNIIKKGEKKKNAAFKKCQISNKKMDRPRKKNKQ